MRETPSRAPEPYAGAWKALRLSSALVGVTASRLSAGETFRIRFTVTNQADGDGPDALRVVFGRLTLRVKGTERATPVAGDPQLLRLSEPHLSPGESSAVEVEMRALRSLGGLGDLVTAEHLATALVAGVLDLRLTPPPA